VLKLTKDLGGQEGAVVFDDINCGDLIDHFRASFDLAQFTATGSPPRG